MKIDFNIDKYYGHGGGWLCQTPAIAIGKDEGFITLTLYVLFWSFTLQLSWAHC